MNSTAARAAGAVKTSRPNMISDARRNIVTSLGIGHRIDAVVGLGFVTPHHAGTACLGHGKTNGNAPLAEVGYLVGNQTGLLGSVRVMTYLAGPPLLALVDMDIMYVCKSVPEIRLCLGLLVVGQLVVVTVEAEVEIILVERHVKGFRKVLFQEVRVLSSVG